MVLRCARCRSSRCAQPLPAAVQVLDPKLQALGLAPLMCAGGTHHGSSQHRCWSRQQHLTDKSFQMRFTLSALGEILGLVQKANLGLALKDTDNKCPYLPQFCQRLPYRFEIPPPSSPHTH